MKSSLYKDGNKVQHQQQREDENPYIIPDEPTIAAVPDTLVCLRNSKWTVKDLSPQIKRRNPETSTPKYTSNNNDNMKDENGYEVPINFKRPIYMDFEPAKPAAESQYKSNSLPKSSIHDRIKIFENHRQSVDDNSKRSNEKPQTIHHTNSQPCICTSNLKPNDSFLAKCLREPIRQQSSTTATKAAQQDRRLPCSPPFLSLSLPVFWEGNKEESYQYEEIIPAFPHRKSLADHDYVEIIDSQEKYLLQSIKDQADHVTSSRSSSSSHNSDVENMWEKVAVPGVLRIKH